MAPARLALVFLLALPAVPTAARACSFCAGSAASQRTLRELNDRSPYVVVARVAAAKLDPSGRGSTSLVVARALKAEGPCPPAWEVADYLPAPAEAPGEWLLFAERSAGGAFVPAAAVPATPAVLAYLAALPAATDPPAARLGFAFAHLDSADASVSADAFATVAKSPDAELGAARTKLDPAKLRAWLADPKLARDRAPVYVLLLGLCARPEDAAWLADELAHAGDRPRVERNLASYLTAHTLASPAAGWAKLSALVADTRQPFVGRFAACAAARYFAQNHPERRPEVLAFYRQLVAAPEFADLAVTELAALKDWDAAGAVLAAAAKPSHAGRLVRRAVLAYALACPRPEAFTHVAQERARDAKLVGEVEKNSGAPAGREAGWQSAAGPVKWRSAAPRRARHD